MAKGPGVLPGNVRRPTITTQTHMAHAEVKMKAYHLGQPWAAGIAALALSALLHFVYHGFWTEFGVAAVGCGIAAFDFHLRASRMRLVARMIGPVTILSVTAMMVDTIVSGFSRPLMRDWLIGGILFCIIWDIWMLSGESKDESRQFPVAAMDAGLGGARLSGLKKHVTPGRGKDKIQHLSADLHLSGGQVTPSEASSRLDHLEGAMNYPPGSITLSPDSRNASKAQIRISDPATLDAEPLDWPYGMEGSRPGTSIAEPISGGIWQDGEEMLYDLRNHHLLGMGATGSGKFSWAANQIGEGVTRVDYACLAADLTKGEQFLGPMRPALHELATEPGRVLAMFDGIERIAHARRDWMGARNLTQWAPGCGLTFLDIWLEEVSSIVALLDKQQLKQLKETVRSLRSLGARLDMSTQRTDYNEIPTMIRGQMGKMCFGVLHSGDAEFGLSDEQQKRGCRPQRWGVRTPGKCYIDAPSIPDDRIVMPMRWWYWGPDSSRIGAFAQHWPAQRRPFDDVTGEAWEAAPGPAASTAFPVAAPSGARPPQAPDGAADDGPPPPAVLHLVTAEGKTVSIPREPVRLPREKMIRAVCDQLEDWRTGKTSGTPRQFIASKEIVPIVVRFGRKRTVAQEVLNELSDQNVLKSAGRGRWEILEPLSSRGTEEEQK